MIVTNRIKRIVHATWDEESSWYILGILAEIEPYGSSISDALGHERLELAMLKLASHDLDTFDKAVKLCLEDWRDLLAAAGMANEGWEVILREADPA